MLAENINGAEKQKSRRTEAWDDEIDLFELVEDLLRQKWLIVAFVVLAAVVAVVFLFVSTPVYQVQSRMRDVSAESLARVAIPGVEYTVSPGTAFSAVARNLSSLRVRKAFFSANQELFAALLEKVESGKTTPEQAFEEFDSENFHLSDLDGRATSVRLTYPATMDGVAIVRGLMDYAIGRARQDLTEDFQDALAHQLEQLRYEISSKRVAFVGGVLYGSSGLTRSLSTAELLGIKRPTRPYEYAGVDTTPLPADPSIEQAREIIRAEISNQNVPHYFLGTQALSAELQTLKSRLGDDLDTAALGIDKDAEDIFEDQPIDNFIEGLYHLNRRGRYLSNVHTDLADVALVDITREATPPTKTVKPKKKLVLALALVLGGMLGVFVALLRAAWQKRNFRGTGPALGVAGGKPPLMA